MSSVDSDSESAAHNVADIDVVAAQPATEQSSDHADRDSIDSASADSSQSVGMHACVARALEAHSSVAPRRGRGRGRGRARAAASAEIIVAAPAAAPVACSDLAHTWVRAPTRKTLQREAEAEEVVDDWFIECKQPANKKK